MEKDYLELIGVLERLVVLHRDLLKVEQDKLTLILDQNWQDLGARIDESAKVLERIEACEKKRRALIERMGGKDIPLSELLQNLPEDQRRVLKTKGEELQGIVLELKSLNSRSKRLLDSSLEVINFTLSLFSGAGTTTKTYSGSGREEAEPGKQAPLVFDLKV